MNADGLVYVSLVQLMALEFKEREGEVQAFIARLYAKQCAFIEELVRGGQESGVFRSDVPTSELASMVLAINASALAGHLAGRPRVWRGRRYTKVATREPASSLHWPEVPPHRCERPLKER